MPESARIRKRISAARKPLARPKITSAPQRSSSSISSFIVRRRRCPAGERAIKRQTTRESGNQEKSSFIQDDTGVGPDAVLRKRHVSIWKAGTAGGIRDQLSGGKTRAGRAAVSSAEVGRARKIPTALAAKLLSQMATAGLTLGTTGPGGGYRWRAARRNPSGGDREPVRARDGRVPLPFRPRICGTGDPCPLHHDFLKLEESGRKFLEQTTLEVFVKGASRE